MKTLIDRTFSRSMEISDKDFYYILAAADSDIPLLQRTMEGFRGFAEDCLERAHEKGVLYGTGVWEAGAIRHTPAMQQAYEMGKNI